MANTPRLATALALCALIGIAGPARGQDKAGDRAQDQAVDQALGDHDAYRKAVATLQQALRDHDAAGFAALVGYPITVKVKGRRTVVRTARQFAAQFDDIVTPDIVAAVRDQAYDSMMANYQGLMLGRGEIWLNGICRDTACATSDIRVITIQRTGLPPEGQAAAPPPVTAAAVPPLKQFKNWAVGCDNLRACTALGMISDTDKGAYIKISRGAGAEDQPRLDIVVAGQDTPKAPSLRLALAGGTLPAGLDGALKLRADDQFVTGTLEGAAALPAIAALSNATSLTVTVIESGRPGASETVPLAGSAAALLFMDDAQKRIGTVTALTRKGTAPASSIPAAPAAPVVKAVKLTELKPPVPRRPKGVAPPPADSGCDANFPDSRIGLSDTLTLWGVCSGAGAYNIDYAYWIVGDGAPRPAVFPLPGRQPDAGPGIATNLGLASDGMSVSAFVKGEGIGDCGTASEWAWDGTAFQLIEHAEMTECRGVLPDDWPVLYRARRG